jgi:hypothetical protein
MRLLPVHLLPGVADLAGAQEVSKTSRLRYELRCHSLQTFPLMDILEVLGLKNAITMFYIDDKSRFC